MVDKEQANSRILPAVFWYITVKDNEKVYVDQENAPSSPWLHAKSEMQELNESISSLSLCKSRSEGSFCVGSFADKEAYFFSNRATINFGDTTTTITYGIGFLENDIVKITWFNSELEAIQFEERNVEQCRETLIFRNTQVNSSLD